MSKTRVLGSLFKSFTEVERINFIEHGYKTSTGKHISLINKGITPQKRKLESDKQLAEFERTELRQKNRKKNIRIKGKLTAIKMENHIKDIAYGKIESKRISKDTDKVKSLDKVKETKKEKIQ